MNASCDFRPTFFTTINDLFCQHLDLSSLGRALAGGRKTYDGFSPAGAGGHRTWFHEFSRKDKCGDRRKRKKKADKINCFSNARSSRRPSRA